MRKDVGVKIIFDDVDYSEEERDLLWGRFFMSLVKLSQKKEGEKGVCQTY